MAEGRAELHPVDIIIMSRSSSGSVSSGYGTDGNPLDVVDVIEGYSIKAIIISLWDKSGPSICGWIAGECVGGWRNLLLPR